MTESYVCPGCQRLVSFSGEAEEWIDVKCSHCGREARVKVLNGPTVICEEVEG